MPMPASGDPAAGIAKVSRFSLARPPASRAIGHALRDQVALFGGHLGPTQDAAVFRVSAAHRLGDGQIGVRRIGDCSDRERAKRNDRHHVPIAPAPVRPPGTAIHDNAPAADADRAAGADTHVYAWPAHAGRTDARTNDTRRRNRAGTHAWTRRNTRRWGGAAGGGSRAAGRGGGAACSRGSARRRAGSGAGRRTRSGPLRCSSPGRGAAALALLLVALRGHVSGRAGERGCRFGRDSAGVRHGDQSAEADQGGHRDSGTNSSCHHSIHLRKFPP